MHGGRHDSTGHRFVTSLCTPLLRCEPAAKPSDLAAVERVNKTGGCQAPRFEFFGGHLSDGNREGVLPCSASDVLIAFWLCAFHLGWLLGCAGFPGVVDGGHQGQHDHHGNNVMNPFFHMGNRAAE